MNKMKCFSAALVAFFLSAAHLCAQDIEKEFDDFAKQQQQEFEDFKNKADAEFETFLRETWQKYEAFAAIPAPERPEPPKPVEFDKTCRSEGAGCSCAQYGREGSGGCETS